MGIDAIRMKDAVAYFEVVNYEITLCAEGQQSRGRKRLVEPHFEGDAGSTEKHSLWHLKDLHYFITHYFITVAVCPYPDQPTARPRVSVAQVAHAWRGRRSKSAGRTTQRRRA